MNIPMKKNATFFAVALVAVSLSANQIMAKTVQGGDIMVDAKAGVMTNESTVTGADVGAANGVIHIIDPLLIPKS